MSNESKDFGFSFPVFIADNKPISFISVQFCKKSRGLAIYCKDCGTHLALPKFIPSLEILWKLN